MKVSRLFLFLSTRISLIFKIYESPHSKYSVTFFKCIPVLTIFKYQQQSNTIQCDEQRPTCGPCTKRELTCHFQPNTGFENGQSPSDGAIDPLLRERSHGPLPARTLELKLLHHFITSAYKTFYPRESDVHCWQVHIPDMAFEHTFLLDGLLAMSALHLAHLEAGAKKSWLQTALRYQDLTLAGLNKALCRISSENCEAVAVCSIFVLVLSIAIPGTGAGARRSRR